MMPSEHVTAYPSKIDSWLLPVLILLPVTAIAVCVAAVVAGSTIGLLVGVAFGLLVAAIYGGLVFPMRYQVGETNLVVRSGILRRRIPFTDIIEVHPTSNPLSAPALSLDRLQVRFGKGVFKSVLVSPANRNYFLDELAQKAGLRREGDRLIRVAK